MARTTTFNVSPWFGRRNSTFNHGLALIFIVLPWSDVESLRPDHGETLKVVVQAMMGDKGKGVMPPADRTVDRRVTTSKRRVTKPGVGARAPRGRAQVMHSSVAMTAHVVSEDSEKEMSREIEVGFEEYLGDEERVNDFDDDNDEDHREEDDDELFIQNQASESTCRNMVTRDNRGRYIRCGDSTYTTRRKKAKIDLSWRLRSVVYGGPSHFNVLRSFDGHVAFNSWNNPEKLRSWTKCHERTGCLGQMNGIKLCDAVSRRVSDGGLGHLSRCMTTNLDENLISAFVERKIFVNGQDGDEDDEGSSTRGDECLKTRVATFLAVDIDDVVPPIYKGGGLLTTKLRNVVETGNEHDSLRAYLMMLVGQTLFLDKSGDRVIARMLGFFEDLSAAWIYEYFPDFRPHRGYYVKDKPLVEGWSHVPRFKGDRSLLEQHRQRLDGLRAEHVAWTPYDFCPDRECRTTLYSGLIRFLDILESYQPDRCLRLFGYCQTILMHLLTPATDHRPAKFQSSGYRVNFGQYDDDQWGFVDAKIKLSELSKPAVMQFETVPRYKIWFEKISHTYLYPSTHRVEFARVGPIWEEPEVARAVARKFSGIYMQPTVEARRRYVDYLVGQMEDYFTIAGDEDDTDDEGNQRKLFVLSDYVFLVYHVRRTC
ncbi:hypothetical protein RND81_06G010900 [Saponaria officinalis]|uniref:Aminotransferase-like plant mobile domain-containing protein n=1 Tax=Saponaria officinalis TaxID=3572 RepID=A0AAW1K5A7_SAPOF